MTIRIQCLTIDSHDPQKLASFWSEVLGWRIAYEDPDEYVIEPAVGTPECDVCPDLLFIKVDEGKAGKNRLHLDLRPTEQQAEVERILALGATRTEIGQTGEESWAVLADPEGNEFCVLRPLTEEELSS